MKDGKRTPPFAIHHYLFALFDPKPLVFGGFLGLFALTRGSQPL